MNHSSYDRFDSSGEYIGSSQDDEDIDEALKRLPALFARNDRREKWRKFKRLAFWCLLIPLSGYLAARILLWLIFATRR